MGFYHFVLVVAAVFLTRPDPASASKMLRVTAPDAPTRAIEYYTPTKRSLRASTTDYEDDEERGISAKIPGLEKISNSLKSSNTKELQALLKADESLGNAFKTLKLSTMPIGKDGFIQTKKVVKFFSSPNFKAWSKHATMTNPRNPEGAMFTALTNVFGEKNVATMILLGKHTWSSKSAAKKLEKVQFDAWISQKKTPDDVIKGVMGVKPHIVRKYARVYEIAKDYGRYRLARVFKLN